MNTDRRTLLLGSMAVAATAVLPTIAAAEIAAPAVAAPVGFPPGTNQFGLFWDKLLMSDTDRLYAQRVVMTQVGLGVRIMRHSKDEIHEYENLRELLLHTFPMSHNPIDGGDPVAVEALISECSSNIARCSRRDLGNLVLVSPNTHLDLSTTALDVGVTDALYPNEMLVVYRNPSENFRLVDAPFVAETLPSGRIRAFVTPGMTQTVGSARDYARFVYI